MATTLNLGPDLYPHHDETIFQDGGTCHQVTFHLSPERYRFLLQRAALRERCTLTLDNHRTKFYPQASEILPGLYISDMYSATSPQLLDNLGITHILSLHSEAFDFGSRFKTLWVRAGKTLNNDPDALLRILPHTNSFLTQAMKKEGHSRVLVSCFFGVDAGPAVVIGFLIARHCMTYEAALAHVQERRPVVRIDPAIERQLITWQTRRRRMLEKALELRLQ